MHFARNYTCGRTAFMGDIVQYTSPYLFPFVIEYSFIAAAVLIAMWKSVGKNPRYVVLQSCYPENSYITLGLIGWVTL